MTDDEFNNANSPGEDDAAARGEGLPGRYVAVRLLDRDQALLTPDQIEQPDGPDEFTAYEVSEGIVARVVRRTPSNSAAPVVWFLTGGANSYPPRSRVLGEVRRDGDDGFAPRGPSGRAFTVQYSLVAAIHTLLRHAS